MSLSRIIKNLTKTNVTFGVDVGDVSTREGVSDISSPSKHPFSMIRFDRFQYDM